MSLLEAVHTKKLVRVDQALFLHKKQINVPDYNGATPLLYSAIWNLCGIARRLLKHGADASIANHQGQTALHFAVRHQSPTLTSVFIKAKADLDAVNVEELTPLHIALNECQYQNAVLLLNAGCKTIDVPDRHGNLPFHVAAYDNIHPLLKLLHKRGSNAIDARNTRGWRPIHLSVDSSCAGGKKTIDTLMRLGCTSIDTPAGYGETPLFLAVKRDNAKLLCRLIMHGSKSLDVVFNRLTSLRYALNNRKWRCARVLYLLGADRLGVQASDFPSTIKIDEEDAVNLRRKLFFTRSLTARLLFQDKRLTNQRISFSSTVKRRRLA